MKSMMYPGIFEVQAKTGKTSENATEIQTSVVNKLLGTFQLFPNSLCFCSGMNVW